MAADFMALFADAVSMPADQIAPDSVIRELEKWDSIAALMVLNLVQDNYGVTLSGDDFASVTTVADLEKLVASRTKR
jgi:acyl carrier protein